VIEVGILEVQSSRSGVIIITVLKPGGIHEQPSKLPHDQGREFLPRVVQSRRYGPEGKATPASVVLPNFLEPARSSRTANEFTCQSR
jgi:hypothetical protein